MPVLSPMQARAKKRASSLEDAPWIARRRVPAQAGVQPFRQVLMNFLRSSPASFLSPAVLLQAAILSCCAFCLADGAESSPLRHVLMNFLRSSPASFLVPAFSLHAFIRSCCFFCASLGSFLASVFAAGAGFLSSVFVCAIASGDAASIRQHSVAITCFMSPASSTG